MKDMRWVNRSNLKAGNPTGEQDSSLMCREEHWPGRDGCGNALVFRFGKRYAKHSVRQAEKRADVPQP